MKFEVHPLTPDRWADFVELFERRGPRGGYQNAPAFGCWCMYWRDRSLEHGEPKKRAMQRPVRGPHLEKRRDYMGHIDLFRAHGFEPVRESSRRAVVKRRASSSR